MSAYEFWGGHNSAYNTGERGIKRVRQTTREEKGTDSFDEHMWGLLQEAKAGLQLLSFQRERRGHVDGMLQRITLPCSLHVVFLDAAMCPTECVWCVQQNCDINVREIRAKARGSDSSTIIKMWQVAWTQSPEDWPVDKSQESSQVTVGQLLLLPRPLSLVCMTRGWTYWPLLPHLALTISLLKSSLERRMDCMSPGIQWDIESFHLDRVFQGEAVLWGCQLGAAAVLSDTRKGPERDRALELRTQFCSSVPEG